MSNVCQFNMVKELPALGHLYNNVCKDVTCAGMPVVQLGSPNYSITSLVQICYHSNVPLPAILAVIHNQQAYRTFVYSACLHVSGYAVP